MQNIIVKRYSNPKEIGWAGWIEDETKTWIAFIDLAGKPTFFLNRDPVTGGVLPDDPTEREEQLRILRGAPEVADGFVAGPSRKPPPNRS